MYSIVNRESPGRLYCAQLVNEYKNLSLKSQRDSFRF